jgi:hypothetical protein
LAHALLQVARRQVREEGRRDTVRRGHGDRSLTIKYEKNITPSLQLYLKCIIIMTISLTVKFCF